MISKIIAENEIIAARDLIYDAGKIVIIGHQTPDGDALGSSLALYHFLFAIDREATVMYPDRCPESMKWLPGAEQALVYFDQPAACNAALSGADLIICVDFNAMSRLSKMKEAFLAAQADKIMIDHHPNPEQGIWQLMISYPQISSCSEMIFRLICRMGHATEISRQCAECIYTGMMTDTGGFSYNSNNPEIYYIIGELIKKGINKDEIARRINTFSLDRMRLMGHLLVNKMKIYPHSKTALITLTAEEQKLYNFRKGDSEGFVNLPLSIENIVFSVFIKEEKDRLKLSFRSRGAFAVNEVASKYFNGGGHVNAAGGESFMSMEETVGKFEDILAEHYTEQLMAIPVE